MNLLFLITLLLMFVTPTVSKDFMRWLYCIPCNFDLGIPYAWHSLQDKLEYACMILDDGLDDACSGLVLQTDLTSSWPRMYPHAVKLRELACGHFC